MVQFAEEDAPWYRHASIDIFVDPAADNKPAIRCYASVGFRPVCVLRGYEGDIDPDTGEETGGWHHGLLMDVLAHELIDRTDPPGSTVGGAAAGR